MKSTPRDLSDLNTAIAVGIITAFLAYVLLMPVSAIVGSWAVGGAGGALAGIAAGFQFLKTSPAFRRFTTRVIFVVTSSTALAIVFAAVVASVCDRILVHGASPWIGMVSFIASGLCFAVVAWRWRVKHES